MALVCPSCGNENADTALMCELCQTIFRRVPAKHKTPPPQVTSAPPTPHVDFPSIAKRAVESFRTPAAAGFGFLPDLSPASILNLDNFITATAGSAGDAPGQPEYTPSASRSKEILMFGAYLGECLRASFGGYWQDDPKDPDNPLRSGVNVNGPVAMAIEKVFKRYKNGASDALFALYQSLEKQQRRPANAADSFLRQAHHVEYQTTRPPAEWVPQVVAMYQMAADWNPTLAATAQAAIARLHAGVKDSPQADNFTPSPDDSPYYAIDPALRRTPSADVRSTPNPDHPVDHAPAKPVASPAEIQSLRQEAERQGQLGNTEEFIRLHARVFELDPKQLESLRQMAIGKATIGRHEEALADFDELLRRVPDDPTALDNRATLLGRMGRLDEAIASFAGLLSRRPASTTWHRRATVLQQAGRLPEALEDAKHAVEADPNNFPAWLFRADVERQLGQTDAAITSLRTALERAPHITLDPDLVKVTRYRLWELENPGQQLHPAEAEALRAQAFMAGAHGQPQRALELLDESLKLDPFSAEAWFNRAAALVTVGRPEDAVYCYRKAGELDGRNRMVWRALARRLLDLQRWEEALAPLDRWIELDARDVEAWKSKASALNKLRRFQEAAQAYDRAIALAPKDQELLLAKSVCLDQAGQGGKVDELPQKAFADPAFAERYHQRGVELAQQLASKPEAAPPSEAAKPEAAPPPEELQALLSRATMMCTQGQHEQALPLLDRILAHAPSNAQAHAQKAVALAALGRESEPSVRVLLQAAPQEVPLLRRLGQVMQALGRHDEAQLLFRHTLLQDQHADTWLALGTSLAHLRQDKEALAACQRALDRDPQLHVSRLLMAQLHERMDQPIEAADCYEQFINTAPPTMAKHVQLARDRLSALRSN